MAMLIQTRFTLETDNRSIGFALKSRCFALTTMNKKFTQGMAAKEIGISLPAYRNAEQGIMGVRKDAHVKAKCVKWLNKTVRIGDNARD